MSAAARCLCIRRDTDESELQELYLDFHNLNHDDNEDFSAQEYGDEEESSSDLGRESSHTGTFSSSSASPNTDRSFSMGSPQSTGCSTSPGSSLSPGTVAPLGSVSQCTALSSTNSPVTAEPNEIIVSTKCTAPLSPHRKCRRKCNSTLSANQIIRNSPVRQTSHEKQINTPSYHGNSTDNLCKMTNNQTRTLDNQAKPLDNHRILSPKLGFLHRSSERSSSAGRIRNCDNMNSPKAYSRSPLHWAAASGQTAAVRALLDQRADAGATDLEGATPLDYARHAGHTECVALLEAHLGLQSANPASPPAPQPSTGTPSHTKRNPLGFIVDFFRPKHRATSLPRQASSSSQEVATSCTTPRLDTKRHTPEQSRSPMRSPPLTPIKRQKEDEVLLSMEKIHISREDNPLLAKLRSSSQESAGRSPSSTEAGSEENLSHSFIIRSPPPVIKREHSLSPTMARFDTPSSGRARAERDAAEILALQRVLSDPGVTRPDPALPLPPPPGGSHSQLETSRHLPSAVVAEFPPTATRGRQLAPLRGSLPPQHGLHSKGLPSLSSHRALDSGEPLISPAGSTGFQAQSTHAPAALTPTSLAKKKRQRSLEERKFLS